MTAPAWPSSVSGSESPKRGRLISSLCPSARNALPTRPGVEVSWCRTISTGRKGLAVEGSAAEDLVVEDLVVEDLAVEDLAAAACAWPGKCGTVSALILPD